MGGIWRFVCAALLGAFLLQTARIEGFLFFPGLLKELAAEQQAHRDTKERYASAQREAQMAEDARAAQSLARQEKTNAETSSRYAQRLADLAAAYQRLRSQAPAGAGGAPGGQQVPGVSVAAGGTSAAPDDGFPLALRYEASRQGVQLDELISWVLGVAATGGQAPDSVKVQHGDNDDLPDAAGRPSQVSGEGRHPSQ